MLTFLFAAALAVAKIHATHVSMDAKIRDDSNLSQVMFHRIVVLSYCLHIGKQFGDVTSRICAAISRVLGLSRRSRAR
jgi:hypothetical protein